MALLHLACEMAREMPMQVIAAHANHQFRGAESDAEAELVRQAARQWGARCETAELAMPAYIAATGLNSQDASRKRRYAFLHEIADKYDSRTVLLGHHADDQAETVLMRVLRGTGLGGLAGIPKRRQDENVELIRPLLRIAKNELLAYCERNQVLYAVDSSNLTRDYFRNIVRLDIMPMLAEWNPQLRSALIRLADLAEADHRYLEQETDKAFKEGVAARGDGFAFRLQWFNTLHEALQRRLIKLILKCSAPGDSDAEYRQIDEIVRILQADQPAVARIGLDHNRVLLSEYGEVYLGSDHMDEVGPAVLVTPATVQATFGTDGGQLLFQHSDQLPESIGSSTQEAWFDEDRLVYPLVVRSRQPGDVMRLPGMNGSKKVQDIFVDAKIPRSRRDQIPLLVDGTGSVLWIPGLRRSRDALVTDQTRSLLRVVQIGKETRA